MNWPRLALVGLGGLALILATGVFLDAPIIAWAATLPAPVHAFFGWATRFGQSDWLLIPTGVVAIAIGFGDWRGVNRPVAAAWWEIGTFAAVIFLVVAASGLITDAIKPMVGRLRPDYYVAAGIAFKPFSFGGYGSYSFPSGHATTMGAVAVVAAFAPGIVTIPILIAAAVVAVSRVMIGVHFPSDIVGGALIGIGTAYLILRTMTSAGIVFVVRRDGTVRRRLGVVRRVIRRKGGPGLMLAGLGAAFFGRPSRSPSR